MLSEKYLELILIFQARALTNGVRMAVYMMVIGKGESEMVLVLTVDQIQTKKGSLLKNTLVVGKMI